MRRTGEDGGIGGRIAAATSICLAERSRLLRIAGAVTIPIAAAVLVLDLVAWRPVETRPGTVERELGDALRTVDDGRWRAIAIARYALGGAAYVLVLALSLGGLRRALAEREPAPAPLGGGQAAGALAAGIAIVAAVRAGLSLAASTALAATVGSGAAYLAAINAVHAAGKIVTAPFLAALVAVLAAGRRAARGEHRSGRPGAPLRSGRGASARRGRRAGSRGWRRARRAS